MCFSSTYTRFIVVYYCQGWHASSKLVSSSTLLCKSRLTSNSDSDVIFDTGSFDMFIASKECTTCGHARTFDSSQSSTFSQEPNRPQSFTYGTGVDSTSLPPQGEGVGGTIVTDRVDIANLTVPSQQFLLCDRYDEFLADVPFDGVMGIGLVNQTGLPSGQPWYWQLYYSGQIQSPVFSFYYPPGHATGAEMTVGGVNPARYTGDIKYIDLADGGQFDVGVPASYFDGKQSVIPATSAILDSGTPFFTASASTVKDIYAALGSQFKQLDQGGSWGAPCDVIDSLAVEMTFTLGSGSNIFNATMPKEAFNLGPYPGQQGMCQGVFSALEAGGSLILGAPLLDRYYTVWDGLNYKMGFAQAKF